MALVRYVGCPVYTLKFDAFTQLGRVENLELTDWEMMALISQPSKIGDIICR